MAMNPVGNQFSGAAVQHSYVKLGLEKMQTIAMTIKKVAINALDTMLNQLTQHNLKRPALIGLGVAIVCLTDWPVYTYFFVGYTLSALWHWSASDQR